jgi:hypothetical protein
MSLHAKVPDHTTNTKILGGYILVARKMFDSELMNKPPHFLKLWIWILSKAFWKDGETLKRGQLLTSIDEMQDVGRYQVGGRMEGKLTVAEVRSAYGYFQKTGAILVSKSTRGMVISVCNFDTYQTPSNYEQHSTPNSTPNRTPKHTDKNALPIENVIKSNHFATPEQHTEQHTEQQPEQHAEQHSIDEERNKNKNSCTSPTSKRHPAGDHQTFLAWWSYAYESTQGKPYLTSGKDFKPVKELLAAYGLKPLVITACWFLTCQDTWLGSKRDITMFKSQINRLPGPKGKEHNADAYRAAGIIPPEGTLFEDWHFWQQNEGQDVLAL